MWCVTWAALKLLGLEAFTVGLGLRRSMFQEGRAPKVCLGNSDMVSPDAEVEFWAVQDALYPKPGQHPRRKISALVFRKFPPQF